MDQDFPGKVTHCRYLNFFYLDRKAERGGGRHNNEQICQRQRKNPRQKWKNRKMCWGARQRIDIQLLRLRFEAIVYVFVSKGNLVLYILFGKFWFDDDFFFSKSGRQRGALPDQPLSRRNFFSFPDRMVLFLSLGLFFFIFFFFLSFFSYQGLSSALVFPQSKIFFKNIELSCVNFVNCVI